MLVFLIVAAIAGIVGAIAGIMLGLRFKVLILVPAILLATAVITVTGTVRGHELSVIALTLFGTGASLQIGYMVGCVLQVMTPAHLPARTTVRYRPPKVAIVPVDVELERAGVAHRRQTAKTV
jgi:hypothetical protein